MHNNMTGWNNLTPRQQNQTQLDYGVFFKENPNQKNPTDANTQEKWEYMCSIGFERYSCMLAARKAPKWYKLEFTKPEFWGVA